MPKTKNGRNDKRVDQQILAAMTIRDLKLTASDEKGKLKYIKGLDYVLNELYGIKKLGSRLISGKSKELNKIKAKINLTGLIKLFCDREDKEIFRTAIIIYHKAIEDNSLTDKEVKKHLKKIRKTVELLRKSHGIVKYKNEDDVSIKELEKYISNNEYDDFIVDDDEGDYDLYTDISPRRPASNVERYLDSVDDRGIYRNTNDDMYPEFDDDDDEYDDDEDDNTRHDNIADSPIIGKIASAMNSIIDRLENLEQNRVSNIPPSIQQDSRAMHKHSAAMDSNTAAIIGSINNLNKVVSSNNSAIGQLASNLDAVGDTVSAINDEVTTITRRVNSLTEGYNMIINDLYEDDAVEIDSDDEDNDNIIIKSGPDVSIDDINNALSSDELVEVPEETQNTPIRVNPVSIKDMK